MVSADFRRAQLEIIIRLFRFVKGFLKFYFLFFNLTFSLSIRIIVYTTENPLKDFDGNKIQVKGTESCRVVRDSADACMDSSSPSCTREAFSA